MNVAVGVDPSRDLTVCIRHPGHRLPVRRRGWDEHHRPGRTDKTSKGNHQAPNEVTFRPTGWCAFDAPADWPADQVQSTKASHTQSQTSPPRRRTHPPEPTTNTGGPPSMSYPL